VDVVIDKRPLWLVLLDRLRRPLTFGLLAALFLWVIGLEPPEGLSPAGLKALGIFGVSLVLWATGALPLGVTGLLAIALIALTGVLERDKVFALFGNEAIFFFLSAFLLAAAVLRSGLSTRIAVFFLRRFGHSPARLLLGLYGTTAFLSFWLPAQAVAAMVFPILLEILRALRLTPGESRYGRALCLALGWGAAVGSSATLLGGSRIPLALQIFHETTGQSIRFSEYFLAAFPLVLAMGLFCWAALLLFYRPEVENVARAAEALERRNREMGKLTGREMGVGGVVVAAIAGWLAFGHEGGLASIGIAAVVLLFALRLARWKDVEGYVNWGIILMYGGAICLGAALYSTGAAAWAAQRLGGAWGTTALAALVAFALLTKLLTEGMSNSGVVAVLLPLGLGVAAQRGFDAKAVAFTVAIVSGFDFILPAASPEMALAYSPGFLRVRDVLLPGLLLAAASIGVFWLVARLWWPLLGLEVGR
jgi:sodium-dependent dicarboxylate transporter 2/3/5